MERLFGLVTQPCRYRKETQILRWAWFRNDVDVTTDGLYSWLLHVHGTDTQIIPYRVDVESYLRGQRNDGGIFFSYKPVTNHMFLTAGSLSRKQK